MEFDLELIVIASSSPFFFNNSFYHTFVKLLIMCVKSWKLRVLIFIAIKNIKILSSKVIRFRMFIILDGGC